MGDERGVVRIEFGPTIVLVLPAGVDRTVIDDLMTEIADCAAGSVEQIVLDLTQVQNVDRQFVHALRVWAAALDDEGVELRIRRPQPAVRATIVTGGAGSLIAGF